MFDLRLVFKRFVGELSAWLAMGMAIGIVIFWVFVAPDLRQSTAAAQESIAGQTDIGLQRRQVRALERIATELRAANRNARRCR